MDQLSRTLMVDRMAIFLASGEQDRFLLAKSFGIQQTGGLDLGFLSAERPETAKATSSSRTRTGFRAKLRARRKPSRAST